MERPVRKIIGLFSPLKQIEENERYIQAMKDYEAWQKLEHESKRLENERLKLENEQQRAIVEAMRKKEGLGGSEQIYDRIKTSNEPVKKSFIQKLNELFE